MTFLKKEFLRNLITVCKECDVVKFSELDRFGLTPLNMAIVYRNTYFIEILVEEENVTLDLQKSGATLRLRYELDPILLLVMKHLSSPFQGRLIGGQTSRTPGDLTHVMDLCLSRKKLKDVMPCSITGKTPLMAAAEANVAADMLSTLLASSGSSYCTKFSLSSNKKIIDENLSEKVVKNETVTEEDSAEQTELPKDKDIIEKINELESTRVRVAFEHLKNIKMHYGIF